MLLKYNLVGLVRLPFHSSILAKSPIRLLTISISLTLKRNIPNPKAQLLLHCRQDTLQLHFIALLHVHVVVHSRQNGLSDICNIKLNWVGPFQSK